MCAVVNRAYKQHSRRADFHQSQKKLKQTSGTDLHDEDE